MNKKPAQQPKPRQWTRWAWVHEDGTLGAEVHEAKGSIVEWYERRKFRGKVVKVIVTEVKGAKRGK